MKRMTLFWAVMGLLSLRAWSQKDPGALLAAAEYRFSELDAFSCELRMQVRGPQGGSGFETGTFHARKGSYHVDFHEDQMICDGREVQTWSKAFADANIAPYEARLDLSLMGVYHLYQRGLGMEYLGTEAGMDKVKLTGGEDMFAEKIIWIGEESGLIERYELVLGGGRSYYYELHAPVLNPELDDHLFEIDRGFVERVQRGEVPAVDHHHPAEAEEDHGHEGHDHGDHEGHDHGGGHPQGGHQCP